MADVVLEQVSKTYPGGVRAVADLSLAARDGELLVLVGPSGCGKTTTLRLIAGLEAPTAGLVRIGGRPVNDVPPWQRDVALAFQRPALYPHLTVGANLAFGLALYQGRGWLRRLAACCVSAAARQQARGQRLDRKRRVHEAARTLGLEELLGRYPAQLSGGQQQRVALGRALVRRPAVFLLDEPLSGLDARHRTELRRQLLLLHRRLQATMIYVTHDPVEAMTLGDRVAVMSAGAVEQVDRPLTVYRQPGSRFVAGFLGWPPMSFLHGEVVAGPGGAAFVGGGGTIPPPPGSADWSGYAGQPLTLGIRPEDVIIRADGKAGPTLVGTVALVEPLGRFVLVTCTAAGWRLAGMLAVGEPTPLEGQNVMAYLDLTQAYLFDRRSGRTLLAGSGTG
jgi:multiple sugar transport system ATP-binding protein